MGARGRGKRQHRNKKIKNKTNHKTDRKGYYSHNKRKRSKPQQKRKYENENNLSNEVKKQRLDEEPTYKKLVPSDSEEEIDPMTQLISTFQNVKSNNYAVESSDDTEESDNDENIADEFINEEGKNSNHQENINDSPANGENTQKEIKNEEIDDTEENEEENINDKQEDILDSIDPFARHLFYELNESLLKSIQLVPIFATTFTEEWPYLGTLLIQIPNCEKEARQEKKDCSIVEEKLFAQPGQEPKRVHLNKDTMNSLCIKLQIMDNIVKSNTSLTNQNKQIPLTPLQGEVFSVINNYQDLYYPQRTLENGEEIRYVYCLHAINHILKTRTKIIHHNARLSKKDDVPEEFRDQGLVRPKILIVVPFRDSAYKVIQFLISILLKEDKGNVINKNRFMEDFTGNELVLPKKNPKPEDYELTFAGNSGDDFRIGITVTKKSLKLYADFYSSDIIIASPLGLRYTIGAEGEPERDYDFLASIELLIFDQTEIFLMQNWDHVLHLMNHIHLQPKDSHGTDFSRVRTWSLNGWAKYYRQTLIFSSILLPEINAIFNKRCFNYAGKVKAVKTIEHGSIRQVYTQLPHVFQKINANTVEHGINARFNYFINKVLPQQKDALMKQTLVFISSYFDYVKIRNYFKKEDINFVQICEYSKAAKVARARDMFFHGDAHFLLYTERHHFFNRIRIKGIRHLVFYQPPNFPNFYYELCNFMQEANMNRKIGSISNMTVTVLYTKYDIQQLAAIVGTERAGKMIQSEKAVHLLVTDGD